MATENTNIPAEQTFETQVNATVDSMVEGKDGNWDIPEDTEVSAEVRYAAGLEKRRRDTQSGFSKLAVENKQLKAEKDAVTKEWQNDASSQFTEEQQTELDELKFADPDAWRLKLNQYETEAAAKFQTRQEEVSGKAKEQTEVERRTELLKVYNEANPDFQLTDDVIENDVPPRFFKQLQAGEITFEEYLDKAKDFLSSDKVMDKGELAPDEPDFHKAGGGSTPSEEAISGAAQESYKDEIY